MKHTRRKYMDKAHGDDCADCRAEHNAYMRRYRAVGTNLIDVEPEIRSRILEIISWEEWSYRRLGAAIGLSYRGLYTIGNGVTARIRPATLNKLELMGEIREWKEV